MKKIIQFLRQLLGLNKPTTVTIQEIAQQYQQQDEELVLLQLINQHRQTIGLGELKLVNYLSYKCQQHNITMIKDGVPSHNGNVQRFDEVMSYLKVESVAENVAYNYSTPNGAFTAWMKSKGHRENLEGDFTQIGLSTMKDGTSHKYYTNIFTK